MHNRRKEDSTPTQQARRAIYLLPNVFTAMALLAGFYAILKAADGDFIISGWAIVFAAVMDSLDGRVARLINAQSDFGAQFDSLSDVVSFGAAPAVLAMSWGLEPMGRFGFAVGFFFTAAAAVRLARFNVNLDSSSGEAFTGLPTPIAGVIVAVTILVFGVEKTLGNAFLLAMLMVLLGFSMVSEVKYTSFKSFDLRARLRTPMQIMAALVVASVSALILIDFGAAGILMIALAYVGYGYWIAAQSLMKERIEFGETLPKFLRHKLDERSNRGDTEKN